MVAHPSHSKDLGNSDVWQDTHCIALLLPRVALLRIVPHMVVVKSYGEMGWRRQVMVMGGLGQYWR